jgi:hypothetical protein
MRPDEFLRKYTRDKVSSDHEMATLLSENQRQLEELSHLKAFNEQLVQELSENQRQLEELSHLKAFNEQLVQELQAIRATKSWRLTKPLRNIRRLLKNKQFVRSIQIDGPN